MITIERLGNPDYVGRWEGNNPGSIIPEFSMYILRQTIPLWPDRHNSTIFSETFAEGLIVDQLGLAVFSGQFGRDRMGLYRRVEFLKIYSELARIQPDGSFEKVKYEANFDEERKMYVGTYSIPFTQMEPKGFTMAEYSKQNHD